MVKGISRAKNYERYVCLDDGCAKTTRLLLWCRRQRALHRVSGAFLCLTILPESAQGHQDSAAPASDTASDWKLTTPPLALHKEGSAGRAWFPLNEVGLRSETAGSFFTQDEYYTWTLSIFIVAEVFFCLHSVSGSLIKAHVSRLGCVFVNWELRPCLNL